ncbi:unannotated protein [freshwater metagenome]|uniref:Unannotated protein n=1 Tax=freshwater metagenome TaxID=449393 RepID=A0A6J7KKY6_9ZZZZ|nr:hypothetical protein [Actinomycetota bacterium]
MNLYGLVLALAVVALVLFIAKVAIGGGIIGLLAIVLLVYIVLNARGTRAGRL